MDAIILTPLRHKGIEGEDELGCYVGGVCMPPKQNFLSHISAYVQLLTRFEGHQDTILDLAWSPQGDWLASSSEDGTLRFWNIETKRCHIVSENRGESVTSVAWSFDDDILGRVDELFD